MDFRPTSATQGWPREPGLESPAMGPHGFPWFPWGPHGYPWGPHGSPWGPHGLPWKIKKCRKACILKIPLFGKTEWSKHGVQFDPQYVSAPFCHVKTPWIALWSKNKNDWKSSFSVFRVQSSLGFCRPLARPPRKSKIHGVGNPWGGKFLENPWTNTGILETRFSAKSQGL